MRIHAIFKLLTIDGCRFVCVTEGSRIGVIDQEGYHYGSHDSRDSFRALVQNKAGIVKARCGIAQLAIVNRQPLPKADLTTKPSLTL